VILPLTPIPTDSFTNLLNRIVPFWSFFWRFQKATFQARYHIVLNMSFLHFSGSSSKGCFNFPQNYHVQILLSSLHELLFTEILHFSSKLASRGHIRLREWEIDRLLRERDWLRSILGSSSLKAQEPSDSSDKLQGILFFDLTNEKIKMTNDVIAEIPRNMLRQLL
jgi:hypothetical protein